MDLEEPPHCPFDVIEACRAGIRRDLRMAVGGRGGGVDGIVGGEAAASAGAEREARGRAGRGGRLRAEVFSKGRRESRREAGTGS